MKKFLAFVIIICVVIGISGFALRKMYPLKYYDVVKTACEGYDIDPLLIMSLIKAESNFDRYAVSAKGAKGLMQVMDSTGAWCAEKIGMENFTVDALFDSDINIRIGVWYYAYLFDRLGDDTLALAAYNAGIDNVRKWCENEEYSPDGVSLEKIPFGETSRYITKIQNNYKIYSFIY